MSFLKCLTLLALVAALDAARFKCDYTFYKDAGGYLKFQEMPLKFDDAKQSCALEGGILASPLNDSIKAAMVSIINSKVDSVEMPLNTATFTGISMKYKSYGILVSVEGSRISEIPHTWAPGEPDNYKDEENCIAMLPDGSMADVKCDESLPHFCFLKEVSAKKLNTCGPKNKDYRFNPTTGSCYKLHRTKLDYDAAAKVCKGEGGHLVIINEDTEAQTVKELCAEHPKLILDNFILIGYRYSKDLGKWVTLQGQTLEAAGYEKWAPGEPNNSSYEYCGAAYPYDVLFNNVHCESKYAFICEKDPEILFCT